MSIKQGGGGSRSHDDRGDVAEINVIPLVDVLLVLLIIFMIAAPLSISGINVQMPEGKAKGQTLNDKSLILTIDDQGDFYIDKSQIAAVNLEEKLKAVLEVRTQKDLYIRADKDVRVAKLVEAMSAGKLAGAEKISMLKSAESGVKK
jgi:biopolymer transport protein TolR